MEDPESPQTTSRRDKVQARLRQAGEWSRDNVAQPGSVLDDVKTGLLFWFRKVWKTRGGGLYALGFAATFFYLEFMDVVFDDIPKLVFMETYDASSLIEFAVEFFIDTLMNTLYAFIWPALLIGWEPPFGLVALVAMVLTFPKYIKPHVERWLLEETDIEESEAAQGVEGVARSKSAEEDVLQDSDAKISDQ